MRKRLMSHHDRKIELYNAAVVQFRDEVLLSESQCNELIMILNEQLPGRCNEIAHRLRHLLNLSIDVQRTEDALAALDNPTGFNNRHED